MMNAKIVKHEGEKYLTKYHLIDELDKEISKFIEDNNMSLERFI